MEVCLRLSQVLVFGGSDYADGDTATIGIEEKRVVKLVVVNEEMEVQPKGVSEYDFGEFGDTVRSVSSDSGTSGFL